QSEGLVHTCAVPRQIHGCDRHAALGEMGDLSAPHRTRGTDAMDEYDLDSHESKLTNPAAGSGSRGIEKRGRWMNHRPRFRPTLRKAQGAVKGLLLPAHVLNRLDAEAVQAHVGLRGEVCETGLDGRDRR